jgi:L-2-hydroxyglutarate oxidase LhgO
VVINCAGLHSDRIALLAGDDPGLQVVPFRGEYYDIVPERQGLVRGLIYPVPDPRFPFLGVHFTRRVHGGLDAGPNAVLSFKREGYKKTDFAIHDAWSELTFPGFWKMALKYWRSGLGEFYRSFSKKTFVGSLQKLVPDVRDADLVPGGSGVRAQAMRPDGSLVDDFQFVCAKNMLHVCNVPSPAATASIPIGRSIANMAQDNFQLDRF